MKIKNREYKSLTESKVNFVAEPFDYDLLLGDNKSHISAQVIVIPNGMLIDGKPANATVYAEDENGEVINFHSVEEAQQWIDNYGDDVKFHIEHGDELHQTPLAYYENSFNESKQIGESMKIRKNESLYDNVPDIDGVMSVNMKKAKDDYNQRMKQVEKSLKDDDKDVDLKRVVKGTQNGQETTKKVTSPQLKKMHLSEELFESSQVAENKPKSFAKEHRKASKLEQYGKDYIYLFPQFTQEDQKELNRRKIRYLGNTRDGESAVLGSLSDIQRYARDYLGYQLNKDYLYKQSNFNWDILEENFKKVNESVGRDEVYHTTLSDGTLVSAVCWTSSTRTYNYEYCDVKVGNRLGHGKYRWMNRPWQRFDFSSALRDALIDAGISQKQADQCVQKQSDVQSALECISVDANESCNESDSSTGYYRVSHKKNGVYQSLLVRANSTEEAKKKCKDCGEIIGISPVAQGELETCKMKGMPIVESDNVFPETQGQYDGTYSGEGSKRGNFYGINGVRFIWHGEWADPEVEYDGCLYNCNQLEDTLWSYYRDDCKENGCVPTDDDFENFVRDNSDLVYETLYEMTPTECDESLTEQKEDLPSLELQDDDDRDGERNVVPSTVWTLVYDTLFPGVAGNMRGFKVAKGQGYDEDQYNAMVADYPSIGVSIKSEEDGKFVQDVAKALKLKSHIVPSKQKDGYKFVAIVDMDEQTADMPWRKYLDQIGFDYKQMKQRKDAQ